MQMCLDSFIPQKMFLNRELSLVFFTFLKFFFAACASVDGGWSGWTAWSGCAAGVCAGNQRIRTRTCTNPIPTEDGKYCDGDSAEQLDCLSEYYAKIVISGSN